MFDPESAQPDKLFSGLGKQLEQVTGETAGLLETAAFTVEWRRVLQEHLRKGDIPVDFSENEDGTASIKPLVSEEDLRGLLQEMGFSQEVIDERLETIKRELGLYRE
jgi:hypothetical protein